MKMILQRRQRRTDREAAGKSERSPEKTGKGGLQSMDGESALQTGGGGIAHLQPQELAGEVRHTHPHFGS